MPGQLEQDSDMREMLQKNNRGWMWRTSFSLSPRHFETMEEADMLKKVVRHSVATALANMVLPAREKVTCALATDCNVDCGVASVAAIRSGHAASAITCSWGAEQEHALPRLKQPCEQLRVS